MATYNKFNATVNIFATAGMNLHTGALKVMLTNTLPTSSNAVKADITEISAANGYSAGGAAASLSSDGQTAGLYKIILNNVVFTATGAFGPFRYVVLYDSTSNNLIAWWDYGSNVTTVNGDTFTVSFDGTNGVLQIQ